MYIFIDLYVSLLTFTDVRYSFIVRWVSLTWDCSKVDCFYWIHVFLNTDFQLLLLRLICVIIVTDLRFHAVIYSSIVLYCFHWLSVFHLLAWFLTLCITFHWVSNLISQSCCEEQAHIGAKTFGLKKSCRAQWVQQNTKTNEPVKQNVDFLSLIGGGVSSQLIQECFCSMLVLGILPTVSCNTVHRSQVMPTQQILTFRHCSIQTTPRDANNIKIPMLCNCPN